MFYRLDEKTRSRREYYAALGISLTIGLGGIMMATTLFFLYFKFLFQPMKGSDYLPLLRILVVTNASLFLLLMCQSAIQYWLIRKFKPET